MRLDRAVRPRACTADVIERSGRPRGVSPDRWDLLLRTVAEEFARAG